MRQRGQYVHSLFAVDKVRRFMKKDNRQNSRRRDNTPNESNSKAHIKSVAGSKISRLIDHITGEATKRQMRAALKDHTKSAAGSTICPKRLKDHIEA